MCFSGITLWAFPSPSLQDIFQTPLEALGAEHRTFLIVLRIARLPERITLSSIVKIYCPTENRVFSGYVRSTSVER